MSGCIQVIEKDGAVTVFVPLRYPRRGGRKLVIGEVKSVRHPPSLPQDGTDKTILKALGRAYRWKRMLESGVFNSITDLAESQRINHSYIRRILRLTLLSPEITETILARHHTKELQLEDLLKPLPDIWEAQKASLDE
jgi:hypothetical protein